MVRTFTSATLYSLVYEMKVVMPLAMKTSSLRVLRDPELEES